MVMLTSRNLKIGTIIEKTLAVIEHCIMPVLIYAAGLTLINSAIGYFTVGMTQPMDQLVIALGKFVVGVVSAYLLFDILLRRTGLISRTEGDVFLPYVGLSILYTLGVTAGMILIIIPGLVIMARWIIAQPLLIARGDGIKQALGESWERTRGSEFTILGALFALLLPLIAVIIACTIMFDPADPVGIVVGQLATSATSVVSLAMGVAIYGLIIGRESTATAFA
ncbi:MAG: glycerophosphoryl diester phosphodiesterase membrane domain-containing protein [Porphyrobacter sp.]|nr:glycerophosphoryl diester phosphodiesterase membrane domain-containing protein [Porphyrobacter sp.]